MAVKKCSTIVFRDPITYKLGHTDHFVRKNGGYLEGKHYITPLSSRPSKTELEGYFRILGITLHKRISCLSD